MRRVTLLLGFVCATACVSVPRPEAELLLTGGRVYTGDNARPWAEAVAIREGKILAVGSQADIQLHAGPATKTIDLAGRLVIPGINDAHVHAPWLAEDGKFVAAPRENVSKESFLAALRNGVTGTPDGVTVRSELPLTLVDAGITRDDLDAISTAVPIRVGVFGGHSAILNTPALRQWGIDENASDPAGGWYGRDGSRLNGWLYEHAYWLPQRARTLAASDEVLRAAIGAFEKEALSYGIT
ncbi:MAG: amidohydrolase family protein, partial [Thermoanaerobaculia bacterium]